MGKMIEAELPDGTVLEFPEGTPDDVMDAAVKRYITANPIQSPAAPAPVRADNTGIIGRTARRIEAGAGADLQREALDPTKSMAAATSAAAMSDPTKEYTSEWDVGVRRPLRALGLVNDQDSSRTVEGGVMHRGDLFSKAAQRLVARGQTPSMNPNDPMMQLEITALQAEEQGQQKTKEQTIGAEMANISKAIVARPDLNEEQKAGEIEKNLLARQNMLYGTELAGAMQVARTNALRVMKETGDQAAAEAAGKDTLLKYGQMFKQRQASQGVSADADATGGVYDSFMANLTDAKTMSRTVLETGIPMAIAYATGGSSMLPRVFWQLAGGTASGVGLQAAYGDEIDVRGAMTGAATELLDIPAADILRGANKATSRMVAPTLKNMLRRPGAALRGAAGIVGKSAVGAVTEFPNEALQTGAEVVIGEGRTPTPGEVVLGGTMGSMMGGAMPSALQVGENVVGRALNRYNGRLNKPAATEGAEDPALGPYLTGMRTTTTGVRPSDAEVGTTTQGGLTGAARNAAGEAAGGLLGHLAGAASHIPGGSFIGRGIGSRLGRKAANTGPSGKPSKAFLPGGALAEEELDYGTIFDPANQVEGAPAPAPPQRDTRLDGLQDMELDAALNPLDELMRTQGAQGMDGAGEFGKPLNEFEMEQAVAKANEGIGNTQAAQAAAAAQPAPEVPQEAPIDPIEEAKKEHQRLAMENRMRAEKLRARKLAEQEAALDKKAEEQLAAQRQKQDEEAAAVVAAQDPFQNNENLTLEQTAAALRGQKPAANFPMTEEEQAQLLSMIAPEVRGDALTGPIAEQDPFQNVQSTPAGDVGRTMTEAGVPVPPESKGRTAAKALGLTDEEIDNLHYHPTYDREFAKFQAGEMTVRRKNKQTGNVEDVKLEPTPENAAQGRAIALGYAQKDYLAEREAKKQGDQAGAIKGEATTQTPAEVMDQIVDEMKGNIGAIRARLVKNGIDRATFEPLLREALQRRKSKKPANAETPVRMARRLSKENPVTKVENQSAIDDANVRSLSGKSIEEQLDGIDTSGDVVNLPILKGDQTRGLNSLPADILKKLRGEIESAIQKETDPIDAASLQEDLKNVDAALENAPETPPAPPEKPPVSPKVAKARKAQKRYTESKRRMAEQNRENFAKNAPENAPEKAPEAPETTPEPTKPTEAEQAPPRATGAKRTAEEIAQIKALLDKGDYKKAADLVRETASTPADRTTPDGWKIGYVDSTGAMITGIDEDGMVSRLKPSPKAANESTFRPGVKKQYSARSKAPRSYEQSLRDFMESNGLVPTSKSPSGYTLAGEPGQNASQEYIDDLKSQFDRDNLAVKKKYSAVEDKMAATRDQTPRGPNTANKELLRLLTAGQKKDVGPGPDATYKAPGIKEHKPGMNSKLEPGIGKTTPPDPMTKRPFADDWLDVEDVKKAQPISKGEKYSAKINEDGDFELPSGFVIDVGQAGKLKLRGPNGENVSARFDAKSGTLEMWRIEKADADNSATSVNALRELAGVVNAKSIIFASSNKPGTSQASVTKKATDMRNRLEARGEGQWLDNGQFELNLGESAISDLVENAPKRFSLKTLQKALPVRMAEKLYVDEETGDYTIDTPRGKIRILPTGSIEIDYDTLAESYSPEEVQAAKEGKLTVEGEKSVINGEALIKIVKTGVLPHEIMHVFFDHFATQNEKVALRKRFDAEAKKQKKSVDEIVADAYKEYFDRKAANPGWQPKGPVGKFVRSISDFFKGVYESFNPNENAETDATLESVRQGEVFGRNFLGDLSTDWKGKVYSKGEGPRGPGSAMGRQLKEAQNIKQARRGVKGILETQRTDLTPRIAPKQHASEPMLDAKTEGAVQKDGTVFTNTGLAPASYSARTAKSTTTQARKLNAKAGMFTPEQIDKYEKDIQDVVAQVLADPDRLDYTAQDIHSAIKENAAKQYKWSEDYTTMCRRRYLLSDTADAIQLRLGRMLKSNEIIALRAMMEKAQLEVNCGPCYVESRRINIATVINKAINGYYSTNNKSGVKTWHTPLKVPKELLLTQEGRAEIARKYPDDYKKLSKMFAGTQMKIPVGRAEYKGEILKFPQAVVDLFNRASGMRSQSWSDFEVPHLLDKMQTTLDKAMRGLAGHSYTKEIEYVMVMKDTGEMINMSLIPEGNGFDKNGKLAWKVGESIRDLELARKIRDQYNNVGFEAIGISDEHIKALLADPGVDYVIPYHSSGLKTEYQHIGKMRGWSNYTKEEAFHDAKTGKKVDDPKRMVFVNEWQGDLKKFDALCKERGVTPPFARMRNWKGYEKLITDRRVFDKAGKFIVQKPMQFKFDMPYINKLLSEFKGLEDSYVVPEVVEAFSKQNKGLSKKDLLAQMKEEAAKNLGQPIEEEEPFQILKKELTEDELEAAREKALARFTKNEEVPTGAPGFAPTPKKLSATVKPKFAEDQLLKNAGRTSISRPSGRSSHAVDLADSLKGKSVIDWGQGKAAYDVKFFQEAGAASVQGYDPEFQPEEPKGMVDIVTNTFVGNVLPPNARNSMWIKAFARAKDRMHVAVRAEKNMKGESIYDGLLMGAAPADGSLGTRTFQKFFTQQELIDQLQKLFPSATVQAGPTKGSGVVSAVVIRKKSGTPPKGVRSLEYGFGRGVKQRNTKYSATTKDATAPQVPKSLEQYMKPADPNKDWRVVQRDRRRAQAAKESGTGPKAQGQF